ncbi:hypothetical protein HPB50_019507 [Hyalomma asiaticum]|uniref:Uncharacterized protein n=1 Tax=Hyalomma asiaticum TaxID=266040 RepID=A0ACB7S1D7_HYAAI|nr:hypothetical protein HPB50_019507 [Hyalomma asiaticum]
MPWSATLDVLYGHLFQDHSNATDMCNSDTQARYTRALALHAANPMLQIPAQPRSLMSRLSRILRRFVKRLSQGIHRQRQPRSTYALPVACTQQCINNRVSAASLTPAEPVAAAAADSAQWRSSAKCKATRARSGGKQRPRACAQCQPPRRKQRLLAALAKRDAAPDAPHLLPPLVMLGDRWLTAWVLLAAALWPRYVAIPEEGNSGSDQGALTFDELEKLRSRYSAVQISRDSEHIKRDLSRVLLFAQQGDLDTEETTFYFMRMHDYDENNHLDGLELMQAFDHLLEHNNETSTETKLVAMVDNLLTVDANNDGLVSFPEWLTYIRSASPKEDRHSEDGANVEKHSHDVPKHSHTHQ